MNRLGPFPGLAVPQLRSLIAGLLTPRVAGVLLAAVVVACHAPAATASCGDYVHVANQTAAAKDDPAPRSPKTPCPGPHCSRNPERTPVLPVTPPAPTVEQAVCDRLDPAAGSDGCPARVRDHLAADPVNRPFRLERPPRG